MKKNSAGSTVITMFVPEQEAKGKVGFRDAWAEHALSGSASKPRFFSVTVSVVKTTDDILDGLDELAFRKMRRRFRHYNVLRVVGKKIYAKQCHYYKVCYQIMVGVTLDS